MSSDRNQFISGGMEGIDEVPVPRKPYSGLGYGTEYRPSYTGKGLYSNGGVTTTSASDWYNRPPEDPNGEVLGRDHAGWKVEAHSPEWLKENNVSHAYEVGQECLIQYGVGRVDLKEYPGMSCTGQCANWVLNGPELMKAADQMLPVGGTDWGLKVRVLRNDLTAAMKAPVYLVEIMEGPLVGLQIVQYDRSLIDPVTYTSGAGRHVDKWWIDLVLKKRAEREALRDAADDIQTARLQNSVSQLLNRRHDVEGSENV